MFQKSANKVLIKRRRPNNISPSLPSLSGGELFMDENKVTLFYGASSTSGITPRPIAGSGSFLPLSGGRITGELTLNNNLNVSGNIVTIGKILSAGIDIHTLFGQALSLDWENISNKPNLVENQGNVFGIRRLTQIEFDTLQGQGSLASTTLYVIV